MSYQRFRWPGCVCRTAPAGLVLCGMAERLGGPWASEGSGLRVPCAIGQCHCRKASTVSCGTRSSGAGAATGLLLSVLGSHWVQTCVLPGVPKEIPPPSLCSAWQVLCVLSLPAGLLPAEVVMPESHTTQGRFPPAGHLSAGTHPGAPPMGLAFGSEEINSFFA